MKLFVEPFSELSKVILVSVFGQGGDRGESEDPRKQQSTDRSMFLRSSLKAPYDNWLPVFVPAPGVRELRLAPRLPHVISWVPRRHGMGRG